MPVINRPFLDTNVILYTISRDENKQRRAIELLIEEPVISAQVLSESSNVLARKYGLSPTDVVLRF